MSSLPCRHGRSVVVVSRHSASYVRIGSGGGREKFFGGIKRGGQNTNEKSEQSEITPYKFTRYFVTSVTSVTQ